MKKIVLSLLCLFITLTGRADEPVKKIITVDPVSPVTAPGTGGVIRGVVVDELNDLLTGATVIVEGSTFGTVTDLDGCFHLPNVRQGDYELTISYMGYLPQTLEVSVEPNIAVNLDTVGLKPNSVQLQEAVVYGTIVRGELKAMSMKKSSFKIVDVIASDGIGKLPDRNAGEAVQRIPGVSVERDQGEGRFVSVRGLPSQWSSSTLNGDRIPTAEEETTSRATAFDFFPSELIDFVEVSKAITPDMEGDAMGGNVNFLTKTSPDKRVLNITLGSGYNVKAEKPMLNGNFVFGDRSADGKIGFLLNASYWNRGWATDNYETRGDGINIDRLELRDYEGSRTTIGLNFATDYKPNDKTKFYLKGMYGALNDDELHYKMRYRFDKFNADNNTIRVELQNIHNILQTALFGIEIGSEFSLSNKTKMDLKLSRYENNFHYGNIPNSDKQAYTFTQFAQDNVPVDDPAAFIGKATRFEMDGGKETKDFISSHVSPGSLDAGKFYFQTFDLYHIRVKETDRIVAQLNLKSKLSGNFELKFGGKFRDKVRQAIFHDTFYTWDETKGMEAPGLSSFDLQGHPKVNDFLSEINSPYGSGAFVNVMRRKDIDSFWEKYQSSLQVDEASSALLSNGGANGRNFNIYEQHTAAYAMGTWNLTPSFTLIGGIRGEYTHMKTEGYITEIGENYNVVKPVTEKNDYFQLLPMLHARYVITDNIRLKAAVTRTFARPDFGSLVAGGSYMAQDNEYFMGNAALEPTKATNFDLMSEFYLGGIGSITAGVFYKQIQDPIFSNTYTMPEFEGHTNVRISQDMNGDDAWLAGFEAGLNKKFDFLPGAWSGLGMNGNYTFMKSEMSIPDRTDKVRIPRQADHLFNACLYYEYKGFSIRGALNYKGAFIMNHGTNSDIDEYFDNYTSLDFNASYKFNSNIMVYLEGNNLLNNPMKYYYGEKDRVSQVEYYGIRGQVGVKFNL